MRRCVPPAWLFHCILAGANWRAHVQLPSDTRLAAAVAARQAAEARERAQLKKLVLAASQAQDSSSHRCGRGVGGREGRRGRGSEAGGAPIWGQQRKKAFVRRKGGGGGGGGGGGAGAAGGGSGGSAAPRPHGVMGHEYKRQGGAGSGKGNVDDVVGFVLR